MTEEEIRENIENMNPVEAMQFVALLAYDMSITLKRQLDEIEAKLPSRPTNKKLLLMRKER